MRKNVQASCIGKENHYFFQGQDTVDLEMLIGELKRIHGKLDPVDLKVAGSKFQKANSLLSIENVQEASILYSEAENSAIKAVLNVQKIDQLTLAYKIKLTSELMRIYSRANFLPLRRKNRPR
jgi:hypothetical protein